MTSVGAPAAMANTAAPLGPGEPGDHAWLDGEAQVVLRLDVPEGLGQVGRHDPTRSVRHWAQLLLLALAGMATLPLVVLPCFAVVRPSDLAALASPSLIRVAQAASHALTVVYLLRLGRSYAGSWV